MTTDLATIPVAAVIAYLEAHGWKREHTLEGERGWTYRVTGPLPHEESQVVVAAEGMGDYVLRLHEVLRFVALHEGRSPEAVLWDIAPPLEMPLAHECHDEKTKRCRRWGQSWCKGPSAKRRSRSVRFADLGSTSGTYQEDTGG